MHLTFVHRHAVLRSLAVLALSLIAAFSTIACDDHLRAGPNANGKPQTGLAEVKMPIGNRTFTLEVADTDESREIGMMHRDSCPADHGMIFVFPDADHRAFWMKNTRISLDILYIGSDGRIVSIHTMLPFDLRQTDSAGPAKYAIELNAGAAANAGVKAGDQLKLPELKGK